MVRSIFEEFQKRLAIFYKSLRAHESKHLCRRAWNNIHTFTLRVGGVRGTSIMFRPFVAALALGLALMPLAISAANTPTFLISSAELAHKLNDRMRGKNLSYRAVEIDCAVTHAAEKCRYNISGIVVLTTLAAAHRGPIRNIVAVHLEGAQTAGRWSKRQLAAIAIYTVLMEVLSPGSNLKDRSIALANLISGLSNPEQGAEVELKGIKYNMIAASAAEVWLVASPTNMIGASGAK